MHPTHRNIGFLGIAGALSMAIQDPAVQAALTRGEPMYAAEAMDRYNRQQASHQHQARALDNRHERRKGTSLLAKARRAKTRP